MKQEHIHEIHQILSLQTSIPSALNSQVENHTQTLTSSNLKNNLKRIDF